MKKVLGDSGSAPEENPFDEEDIGKRFELLRDQQNKNNENLAACKNKEVDSISQKVSLKKTT